MGYQQTQPFLPVFQQLGLARRLQHGSSLLASASHCHLSCAGKTQFLWVWVRPVFTRGLRKRSGLGPRPVIKLNALLRHGRGQCKS